MPYLGAWGAERGRQWRRHQDHGNGDGGGASLHLGERVADEDDAHGTRGLGMGGLEGEGTAVRVHQRYRRDQNNAAAYALFDDATRDICYFRVPYDHGAAARKVIAAGLPIVFAMRLVEGI